MRKNPLEYFRTLGLSPGASAADIKQAYRRLIQRWHPDQFKAGSLMQTTAEDMSKEINEAYEQLYKRQLHKRFLSQRTPKFSKPPFAAARGSVRRAPAADAPPRKARPARHLARWPWIRIVAATGAALAAFALWPSLPSLRPAWSKSQPERTELAHGRQAPRAPRPATPDTGQVATQADVTPVANPQPPSPRTSAPPPGVVREELVGNISLLSSPSAERVGLTAWPVMESPRWVAAERWPMPSIGPEPRLTAGDAAIFADTSSLLRTFELGDSRARVLAVQGAPDDAGDTILRYGSSVVYLADGRVSGWSDGVPRLHVRALPSLDYDLLASFTLGSSRAEVARLQGRPTDNVLGAFLYGSSVIRFESDRVSGWLEGSDSLRVPLLQTFQRSDLDESLLRQ